MVTKLELELEARKGNPRAQRVQRLRQDANFLLVTILWGNVAVNVLLALLSAAATVVANVGGVATGDDGVGYRAIADSVGPSRVVVRAGDAVAPRTILEAIRDGRAAALDRSEALAREPFLVIADVAGSAGQTGR